MNVKKEGKRMVTGYNLHLDKNTSEFQSYIKCGESHLSEQKAKISDCLQNYIINGIADGTRLGKEWFPEIEADILFLIRMLMRNQQKDLLDGTFYFWIELFYRFMCMGIF